MIAILTEIVLTLFGWVSTDVTLFSIVNTSYLVLKLLFKVSYFIIKPFEGVSCSSHWCFRSISSNLQKPWFDQT